MSDYGYLSPAERSARVALYALLPPRERVAKAHADDTLPQMCEKDLNKLGRLLCHASNIVMRKAHPIVGDYHPTKQQQFEDELFGNEENIDPSYAGLEALGGPPVQDKND